MTNGRAEDPPTPHTVHFSEGWVSSVDCGEDEDKHKCNDTKWTGEKDVIMFLPSNFIFNLKKRLKFSELVFCQKGVNS